MAARFFGALGALATIFSFIVLIISYANYPDEVLVYVSSVGEPITYLSKSSMFYIALAFIIIINATLLGLRKVQDEEKNMFQAGLGVTQIFFNMFFSSSIYFINILNSRENFNYSNFGYLIYVTGVLLMVSILVTLFIRVVLKK
jgi:uncharacterized membrane protein